MSERDSSYWGVTSEALRDGDWRNGNREWGGRADSAPESAVSVLGGNPSLALRSLSTVIPDPLEGTPRRRDGTADRGAALHGSMTTRHGVPLTRALRRRSMRQ